MMHGGRTGSRAPRRPPLALIEPGSGRREPPPAIEAPLVVASHRGPNSFIHAPDGHLRPPTRHVDLADALSGALFEADATWVAVTGAPVTPQAGSLRLLDVAPHRLAGYDAMADDVLWPWLHSAGDRPRGVASGRGLRGAWDDYRAVNTIVAGELASLGHEPVFLVQDHHLALVPRLLRARLPGARIAHFTHSPFAEPLTAGALPRDVRDDVIRGMLGADVLGFQAETWADRFLEVASSVPGLCVDLPNRSVVVEDRRVRVGVYPVALDAEPLRSLAARGDVGEMTRGFEQLRGDGALIVRVDGPERYGNARTGSLAFERFLKASTGWLGRVRMLQVMPPLEDLAPPAREHARRALAEVARIDHELGIPGWRPIDVVTDGRYECAVAAFRAYDVLFVNPVADGMNLVAMQGPVVNTRAGALIVSRTTGAWSRLSRHAIGIDPFDVDEGAHAIATALTMSDDERRARARAVVREVLAHQPAGWLTAQLHDLEIATSRSEREARGGETSGIVRVPSVPPLAG